MVEHLYRLEDGGEVLAQEGLVEGVDCLLELRAEDVVSEAVEGALSFRQQTGKDRPTGPAAQRPEGFRRAA